MYFFPFAEQHLTTYVSAFIYAYISTQFYIQVDKWERQRKRLYKSITISAYVYISPHVEYVSLLVYTALYSAQIS